MPPKQSSRVVILREQTCKLEPNIIQRMNVVERILKKELFVLQNRVCYALGMVESGLLRYYIEKDTVEYIKDFYFPGSIVVSYKSFLTGEPSIGSIQALENARLVTLSSSAYNRLLQESSEWFKFEKYISDSLSIKKCRKETSSSSRKTSNLRGNSLK